MIIVTYNMKITPIFHCVFYFQLKSGQLRYSLSAAVAGEARVMQYFVISPVHGVISIAKSLADDTTQKDSYLVCNMLILLEYAKINLE